MEDGVWRTVGGRRIFIKNGQDLASAMKESGKFGSKYDTSTIDKIIDLLDNQEELEKNLQNETDKVFNNLSEDELNDMMFYTCDGYFDINDFLDGKYELPDGNKIVDNINNSISKFNYDKEFTVYSGTSKYHYQNYKKGDIIDINRFISSSTSREVAGVFAGNDADGLILKINTNPKNKGMYIGVSSTMFTEREYLLSNKQKYKVIGRSNEIIREKNFEVLEVETYE